MKPRRVKTGLIFLALIISLILISPVSALTVTMANPDGTGSRDIIAYFANGTLYGIYNTSSIIDLDVNNSYIFTLKPQGNSLIDDPGDWLSGTAFPYVQSNFLYLIILFALFGLLVGRR
jgi:hypothetical protein